ncbi:uncharacterized protein [Primulina eburnea]|uniref:uncharacterized protein n=1 Tax=Primulina eburnea TaxID=1245227 RepID=UPI003C6C7B5E
MDQDGDSMPKPETDWIADEVQNSKALNAIFTSVDMNRFSLITNCTSAKNAYNTLPRYCEGPESVQRTRPRMLTSKFGMLRMEESKNILDYDRHLREIANEAFSLGDPISNERLVRKFLRSLPERFNVKIYAIDVAKDTSQMAVEDLISSLCIFEMNMDMQEKDKGKMIAFQNKGYNVSLSDEESDAEEKSIYEDNHTSLNALLTEKRWLQVNPLCVALGVATPGCKTYDDLEVDEEEITFESVQKLYELLYVDWTKRNKLNPTLMKENTELKAVVAKLEEKLIHPHSHIPRPQSKVLYQKENLLHLFLRKENTGHWYFDSGSLRHMTRSREHLIDYVDQKGGRVTYRGGAKGKIVGNGTLNVEGLPKLHNVLHVEGLNSNLISISQLCDENLLVKFNKHTCDVFDETIMCILTDTRSSDNCYQIGEEFSCNHAQISELDLWHQKLGHVNFKTLKNLCKYDAVRDCQKGKQNHVSHSVLPSSGTTHCLDLLHIDLMGPMEVKIFGDLKKKTTEDDVEELMKIPISLENTGVAPDVATYITTRDNEVTESEEETYIDDDTVDDGQTVPSKIQKNHPSSQINW